MQGFLYGIHGRQDLGVAELRCIELATGAVKWSEPDFGTANLIGVGDKLLIQKTGGELVLAQAKPDRFTPLANARIFPEGSIVQALPALAAGRLFVRDEKSLSCCKLAARHSLRFRGKSRQSLIVHGNPAFQVTHSAVVLPIMMVGKRIPRQHR